MLKLTRREALDMNIPRVVFYQIVRGDEAPRCGCGPFQTKETKTMNSLPGQTVPE